MSAYISGIQRRARFREPREPVNMMIVNMIFSAVWSRQSGIVVKKALVGAIRMLNICVVGSGVAGLSTARRLLQVCDTHMFVF